MDKYYKWEKIWSTDIYSKRQGPLRYELKASYVHNRRLLIEFDGIFILKGNNMTTILMFTVLNIGALLMSVDLTWQAFMFLILLLGILMWANVWSAAKACKAWQEVLK